MSSNPTIEVLDTPSSLALRAADLFRDEVRARLRSAGRFTVALSGGSTPRRLYRILSAADSPPLPWGQIHLFWGDERHLPPDHADSNYRMVKESLLDVAPIPESNIHRIPAERSSAEEAAREYEAELRRFFSPGSGAIPSLDLVLLGLGADGHTASLFPGSALAGDDERLVTAGFVEAVNAHRISLTFPVINASGTVIFLVSGPSKAEPVKRILAKDPSAGDLPASRVKPRGGRIVWLLDRDAASLMERFHRGRRP